MSTSSNKTENDFIEFQGRFLEDVSRTFALTIPQLPTPLYIAVGNAYLLCRIADTIEDEPTLAAEEKKEFVDRFNAVVRGDTCAESFAIDLSGQLSKNTIKGEQELVASTDQVIQITHSFTNSQRKAIERCIRIMTTGMAEFQKTAGTAGLEDIPALNHYCYCVAGVVGEMLTELFCDYSPEIDKRREELLTLAVMFGQGLQMTNILKDMWEDRKRGICWLPRDVFHQSGVNLESIHKADPRLTEGIQELVAITCQHLREALNYVLLIPSSEPGIRRHCLSALGMAVHTLRQIYTTPEFTKGEEVKISRQSVKIILFLTNILARSNLALKLLFRVMMHDFRDLKPQFYLRN